MIVSAFDHLCRKYKCDERDYMLLRLKVDLLRGRWQRVCDQLVGLRARCSPTLCHTNMWDGATQKRVDGPFAATINPRKSVRRVVHCGAIRSGEWVYNPPT
jgi:hypothetical protein